MTKEPSTLFETFRVLLEKAPDEQLYYWIEQFHRSIAEHKGMIQQKRFQLARIKKEMKRRKEASE